MRRLLLCVFLMLCQCTSPKGRRLSENERASLGLSAGVIYDARVCPNRYVESLKTLKVTGDCEMVTCEPDAKNQISCFAKPAKK